MKKIVGTVLLCMGLGSSLFGLSQTKDSKEVMDAMKMSMPIISEVIEDYFQAKTCKKEFTDVTSIEQIKDFSTSYQYGVLLELKYKEKHQQETSMAKATYLALITAYSFMNCGGEDNLGGFIGSTSAMAVELDSKETK